MDQKAHINITLDSRILDWIDTLRGQEPRSTFINKILSAFRGKSERIFDWEQESQEAEEDIRRGRVHRFKTPEQAIRWLKS